MFRSIKTLSEEQFENNYDETNQNTVWHLHNYDSKEFFPPFPSFFWMCLYLIIIYATIVASEGSENIIY